MAHRRRRGAARRGCGDRRVHGQRIRRHRSARARIGDFFRRDQPGQFLRSRPESQRSQCGIASQPPPAFAHGSPVHYRAVHGRTASGYHPACPATGETHGDGHRHSYGTRATDGHHRCPGTHAIRPHLQCRPARWHFVLALQWNSLGADFVRSR
jgi:hypothetical protein